MTVSTDNRDAPSAGREDDLTTIDAVEAYVERTVREVHRDMIDSIRADLFDPLRAATDSAREAHGKARSSLEITDVTRRKAWSAIADYRRGVTADVWEPLAAALRKADLGEPCRANHVRVGDLRESLAGPVPKRLERPEPDDLYAPDAADSLLRNIAKAAVRTRQALQRRLSSGSSPAIQQIPAAHLVRYHARVRLADPEADVLDGVEQRLAEWIAQLERGAASWTHTLLEAERLLDIPSFHNGDGSDETDFPNGPSSPAPDAIDNGPDVDPDRFLASVREEADRLDDILSAGSNLSADDLIRSFRERTRKAQAELETDLNDAGSLGAPSRPSAPPRRVRSRKQERDARADAWPAWHRQAVARLDMLSALSALRENVSASQHRLVDAVLSAGLTPVRSIHDAAADALEVLAEEALERLQAVETGGERALLGDLRRLATRGEDAVQEHLIAPLQNLSIRRAMSEAVDEQIEDLQTALAVQPRSFTVHPRPDPDDSPIDPRVEEHEVDWRTITHDTLHGWLFDQWRTALLPLAEATETTLQRAEEVRQVVQFNLGAAIEEIEDLLALRRRNAGDASAPPDGVANARELVGEGLRRAVERIRTTGSALRDARAPFVRAVWAANTYAWSQLHERARVAGRAREHVLRLQAVLTKRFRDLLTDLQTETRRASVQARRATRSAKQRARDLVRLGQTAVGVAEVDAAAQQETVEALSSIESALETLPVVYRRLFSFRPIVDPGLLVGRDDDRRIVERHVEQWQRGLANALILTGPPGSGLTSLINVLRATTLRGARRHVVEIPERVAEETALASMIARGLGLPIASSDEITLDDVARHLNAEPRPERLRVCTIENLEHVFLRTVGGTELMTRLLGFMSETDTRVLWIGTMSSTAWQAVRASESAATGLVVQHELETLDRNELEELILCRHRRSGLQLDFDVPDEGTAPLLARRVRAADAEEEQDLLKEEFFDRLFSLCGQNVMLALFYWFRAVHLEPGDAEEGLLHVRPLRPMNFDFLDAFSMEHTFALKALLDHGTLTIAELADVLQIDAARSRALLESLGNALLIVPDASLVDPGRVPFTSVDRDTRYRIRPLVLHPVTRFLRSRNVIH